MNIKQWTSTGIILGLITISMPVASAAETGWFIGFVQGEADLNLSVSDFNDGSITSGRADDNDIGWKLFGGYNFNKNLAIEGGYVDLNNEVDDRDTFEGISDGTGSVFVSLPGGPVSVDVQPKGVFVAAVGTIPFENHFAVFGKAGLLNWDADVTRRDLNGRSSDDDDGTDLMYGVGVEYRFRNRVAIRGEWERFTDIVDQDMDLLSVGVSYTFGSP